jgi:hypothetical protein
MNWIMTLAMIAGAANLAGIIWVLLLMVTR